MRWTVIGGALMIAVGLCAVDVGSALAALYRPWPVHRPDRHRRHQCAVLCLCQPLVRSPARLGAGIDFERQLSGRRDLAVDLRTRDLLTRLAAYNAVLRRDRARYHRARRADRVGTRRPRRRITPRMTDATQARKSVMGWPPNLVYALQMCAIFTCCVPMSMPQAHLVAFCSDLGISPVHGAAMLSVLLGSAFLSRQFWGALSDRIGGLYTMLVGSACQTVGIALFLLTQDEIGSVYGFGAVWLRLQRSCAGQCAGRARTVSGRRSLLAHSDDAAGQRLGHGSGKLERRRSL